MTYKKVTTSADNIFSGMPTNSKPKIKEIRLVAGDSTAKVVCYDDAAASGSTHDFLALVCDAVGDSDHQKLNLVLERGLSVVITGASSYIYIYYE